ncbi:MAG: hypothetical protein GY719_36735 [bacterium]|nr:hypothetical protein [bacterium]
MGGYGSGPRGPRKRYVAEYSAAIDARWLVRQGFLAAGERRSGTLSWTVEGADEAECSAAFVADDATGSPGWVELAYEIDGEPIRTRVTLSSLRPPCFLCPGCNRRIRKLYRPYEVISRFGPRRIRQERDFGCVRCLNLAYLKQIESHMTGFWYARRALELEGSESPTDRQLYERYAKKAGPWMMDYYASLTASIRETRRQWRAELGLDEPAVTEPPRKLHHRLELSGRCA